MPTERPIALVISRAGEAVLLVPRLELEHAQATPTPSAWRFILNIPTHGIHLLILPICLRTLTWGKAASSEMATGTAR